MGEARFLEVLMIKHEHILKKMVMRSAFIFIIY